MKNHLPVLLPILLFQGCTSENGRQLMPDSINMTLTSSAFKEGAGIPSQYTCEGTNISPELSWQGAPEGTQTFALIADDPDAQHGTWVHWIAFNIPGNINSLSENASIKKLGGTEGITSFEKTGYRGPCPPSGTHRYYFKLYALDRRLELDEQARKEDLISAMHGHILAKGQLMGTYKKKR